MTNMAAIEIFLPHIKNLHQWTKDNQERLRDEGYSLEEIYGAVRVYTILAQQTSVQYMWNRLDLITDDQRLERFENEVRELQKNVLETGVIKGVSPEFAMTREESLDQCLRADKAFTENPRLQKILADWNYSLFTPNTMATARNLLENGLETLFREGMNHLTAGNTAVGYAVKEYVLERAVAGETEFTITDIGSGSGATLAAIVLGLEEANKTLDKKIRIKIYGIEGCHAFYQSLVQDMIPAMKEKTDALDKIKIELELHYGDIADKLPELEPIGTQVYTSNYVLHRLTDKTKREICMLLRRNIDEGEGALFFADMFRNTSEMPNRRYFNFAVNGPLNPGNDFNFMITLMMGEALFSTVRDLSTSEDVPKHVQTACRYAKECEQGFVIAAYK